MMEIIGKIWFLIAILPVLMAKELLDKIAVKMGRKGWVDIFPETLIVVLSLLVVILYFLGYR